MRQLAVLAGGVLLVLMGRSALVAGESYQPRSHVTRGIYARIHGVLGSSVWRVWGNGFEFVADQPHGGKTCIRCIGQAGAPGQGVGQTVELNQDKPRPVKIAGWSRCENVQGEKSYHYSLYVDFTFMDGTGWPMKLATFETGSHDWQYAETVVTPPKPLRSARFHAFIREIAGTVWFDDLFLGEVDGKNLLRCPGFERSDRADLSHRRKLFDELDALHCNALHSYLGGASKMWDEPPTRKHEVVDFLRDARRRGIGVWLTAGLGTLPIRDAADPNFPQYYCVNGDWGRRSTEALAKVARFPFAGLSMVPDEYNWNNGHLRRQYAKHSDPKVREFYAKIGGYCDCPVCRERFAKSYGGAFPEKPPTREWLQFRYDSTTDWLRRSCEAVKKANPRIRTDSLICVTPLCSDHWFGPGIAWDRAGYEAGLEYATTDPYIQLHNYLGDSTHWYVTETTEHLAAASPQRRCGIVLEASRLRKEHREFDPVEIYGSALSAVWHGADELAWWHHTHVMDISHTTARPEVSRACVSGVYGLLEKIDPWLDGLAPEPGIALLFSRASCDAWRQWLATKDAKPPFDTRGITDPRHASIAQKEVLYYLLRQGYPTTLYYLDAVQEEELAGQKVLVVPFALAISDDRVALLERLAAGGKRVVLMGETGALDQTGAARQTPALRQLIGKPNVVLLEGDVAAAMPLNRDNEKRTRTERIYPSTLNPETAKRVRDAVEPVVGPPLLSRLPEGDDVELCLSVDARGNRLLLAINWDSRERTVVLPKRQCFVREPHWAYVLGPDGAWRPRLGLLCPELRLAPQEALVARLRGK